MQSARRKLNVLLTPAEQPALAARSLADTVCVVFDVLRATSTMVSALANGASALVPVSEIEEAVALRHADPDLLLAGERGGFRITAAMSGGMEFDFGNSPREFVSERVRGRRIAMSTTNGTRALRACGGARAILVGSFLNLSAVAEWVGRADPREVLIICSGTGEEAAYEDTLAAGALCDRLSSRFEPAEVSDSAQIARRVYQIEAPDLLRAVQSASNGRRLLGIPELAEDVPYCLEGDRLGFAAGVEDDGAVRRWRNEI